MNNELNKFLNRNIDKTIEQTRIIEDMIESGNYRYADSTLRDILDWMEKTGDITDAQIRAVENIKRKPSNRYRYGGRRY